MTHQTNPDLEANFNPSPPHGTYMERFGAAGKAAPYSNQKLCFAATDKPFLIALLYELSLRPDCHYVKYSIEPRDHMYLGRCFLTTDQAAGELCQHYKSHTKLLVTLQDDTFFNNFRPK
jgi:hypothetical protein